MSTIRILLNTDDVARLTDSQLTDSVEKRPTAQTTGELDRTSIAPIAKPASSSHQILIQGLPGLI